MAMSLNYTAASTKGGPNFLFEGLELSQNHAALRWWAPRLQGTGTRGRPSPRVQVQVQVRIEMPGCQTPPKQGPLE